MWRVSLTIITCLFLLFCNVVASSTAQQSSQSPVPEDALITLERVALFDCPVCTPMPNYHVTVRADGTVIFRGNKHTRVIGTAEGKVSEDKVRELISAFEGIDYFKLNETYEREKDGCPMFITDRPYAYTSIQIDGRKKRVSHNYGCVADDDSRVVFPQALFELEKKIDEVVNTKQWIE
jgi:uncharacterized protein DUF6438